MRNQILERVFAFCRARIRQARDWLLVDEKQAAPPTALEKRILLSGNPLIDITGSVVTIAAGDCADDGSPDTFILERINTGTVDHLQIRIEDGMGGGSTNDLGPASSITEVRINGSSDDDTFIIDRDAITPDGVFLDGAGGTTDQATIRETVAGAPVFDSVDINVGDTTTTINVNDSSLTGTLSVSIEGVDSITDSLDSDAKNLNLNGSAAEFAIDDNSTTLSAQFGADLSSSVDLAIQLNVPQSSFSVDLDNASSQSFELTSFDHGTVDLNLLGDGTDSLSVGTVADTTANAIVLDGGSITAANDLTASSVLTVQNASAFQIDGSLGAIQLQTVAGNLSLNSDVVLVGGSLVTLDANGGGVVLANVSGLDDGLLADLTIVSDDGISFTDISLADGTASSAGALSLKINDDGDTLNPVQLLIDSSSTMGSIGSLSASGTAAGDSISISSDIVTSVGGILLENADIDIAANLTAATTLTVQNSNSVQVGSTSGAIQLQTLSGALSLNSDVALAGNSLVTLDSNGGGVVLTNVTGLDDNLVADLTIVSDDGISFADISLADATASSAGALSLKINDDGDILNPVQLLIDSSSMLGDIGSLSASGTAAGDSIVISSGITTSVGGILLENAAVSVGANLTAATDLTVQNASTFEIDGTSGAIQLQTLAGNLSLSSDVALGGGSLVTLDANGGGVSLANVTGVADSFASDLTIVSDDGISYTSIDLFDLASSQAGGLSLTVNDDGDTANTQQIVIDNRLGTIGSLTASGSAAGDSIQVASDFATTTGSILLENADIDIGANLTAATDLTVQNAGSFQIDGTSGAIQLQTVAGDLSLNSDVALVGGSLVTLDSNGGGVVLTNVTGLDDNLVADLTIVSDDGISFTNISLADATASSAGALSLKINDDGDALNPIQLLIDSSSMLGDIGSLSASGTAVGDSISISSGITTSVGEILLENADIDIGANLTAATTLTVQNASTLQAGSTSGAIQLQTLAGDLSLFNDLSLVGSSLVTLDANGGGVNLVNVSGFDDGLIADLAIVSDDGIVYTSIDLSDATAGSAGGLSLTVNDDGDTANPQQIVIDNRLGTIGSLTAAGTAAGDSIQVVTAFSSTVGGILLQNADIDIAANLTAATDLTVQNAGSFQIDGSIGAIQLQTVAGNLSLNSDVVLAGGSLVTLDANGGGVVLANLSGLTDSLASDLTIVSDDGISFSSIDLFDLASGDAGALSLKINDDGDTLNPVQLLIDSSSTLGSIGSLSASGTAAGDSISISSDIVTSVGGILLQNANIDIAANLTAATTLTVQNSNSVQVGSTSGAIQLQTLSGALSLNSDVAIAGNSLVTLDSNGGGVVLTNVTGLNDNLVGDLTIVSDDGISFTSISLADGTASSAGALSLKINDDGDTLNPVQLLIDSSSMLGDIGSLSASGTAVGDSISIRSGITTSVGGILLENADISVGANLTAATTLTVQNASTLQAGSTSGAIQLQTLAGDLSLSNDLSLVGSSLVTLDANGGGVNLVNVSGFDDGLIADLTIVSDDGIVYTSIDLSDATAGSAGGLSLTVNDDGDTANTQQIVIDNRLGTIGSLTASGTAAGDSIQVVTAFSSTVGGILLQNADIDIAANLTAATDLTVQNAGSFQIDGTSGAIQLQTVAGTLSLNSDVVLVGGSLVTLDSNGGGVVLANVSGLDDGLLADLTIVSDDGISFAGIDLADATASSAGALSLKINDDGDILNPVQLLIDSSSTLGDIGSLSATGTAVGDSISISSGITTSVGGILLENADIDIGANLTAATTLTVQNASTLQAGSTSGAIQLQTLAGDLSLLNDLSLVGSSLVTLDANGGGVNLVNVSDFDDGLIADLTIVSDDGIVYTSIDLSDATAGSAGGLSLTVNDDGDTANTQQILIDNRLGTIGSLTAGGTAAGDSIQVVTAFSSTVGGILLQNADIDIAANLTAATDLTVQNAGAFQIDGSLGAIQLQTVAGNLSLNSDVVLVGGSLVTLDSNGGGVVLANVSGLDDNQVADLTIVSDDGISFTNISLADVMAGSAGALSLKINDDGDTLNPVQLLIDSSSTLGSIGSLSASGTAAGDSISISSDIVTSVGGILLENADIDIAANLTAATTLTVQNSNAVQVGSTSGAIQLQTLSGALSLNSDVALAGNSLVTLDSNGGGVVLTNVTGLDDNLVADLTIVSDDGISFADISLEDATASSAGALSLKINDDGDILNPVQLLIDSSSMLGDIGSLSASGTAAGDSIVISSGITTSVGGILLENAAVSVGANLTAATDLTVQNASTFEIDGTSGAIQLQTLGGNLSLSSDVALAGGSLVTLDANGGGVSLANVTGVADSFASDLTIVSDDGISYTSIDLFDLASSQAGGLSLTVNDDGDTANTQQIVIDNRLGTIGSLTASGTAAGDSIQVASDFATTTGSILLENADIDIGANLTAATDLTVQNAGSFQIDGTSGAIQLQTVAGSLSLNSDVALAGGSLVTLDSNGGGVVLANVSGLDDNLVADLTIVSDDGISFTGIDLADATASSAGALSLKINDDGDILNPEQVVLDSSSGLGNIGSLAVSGTAIGDSISIGSDITTSVGGILIENADVAISANLTAATGITVQNATNFQIDGTSGAVQLQTVSGTLSLNSDVLLVGGSLVTLDSNGGGVVLASVSGLDDNLVADLTIVSDDGISFTSIDLADATAGTAGTLSLTVNDDGDTSNPQTLVIDSGSGIGAVGSLVLSGGGETVGDTIYIARDITTLNGDFTIENSTNVVFEASLPRSMLANNGDIQISNGIGTIQIIDPTTSPANSLTLTANSGQVVLGDTTAGQGTDLQVFAAAGVQLETVDLSGPLQNGSLLISFDVDNTGNESLALTGNLQNVGALTILGGTDLNTDSVTVSANLSAGSIDMQRAGVVTLDSSGSTGLQVQATNGDLSIQNLIGQIQLIGGSETIVLDANASQVGLGDITLANLVSNADHSVIITAEKDVSINDVSLSSNGDLIVEIDADGDNDAGSATPAVLTAGNTTGISAGSISFSGDSADDLIVLNTEMTSTTGGLLIQNANQLLFSNNLTSAGDLQILNVSQSELNVAADRVLTSLNGGVRILSSLIMSSGDSQLSIVGEGGNVELGSVSTDGVGNSSDLFVSSDRTITFDLIDLNAAGATDSDGNLTFQVNKNSGTGQTFNLNIAGTNFISNYASLQVSAGGLGAGDTINIAGDLATTAGSINLSESDLVAIGANSIVTANGNVLINQNVGSIALNGIGTTDVTISAGGGEVQLVDIADTRGQAVGSGLTINSDLGGSLGSVALDGSTTDGSLRLAFGAVASSTFTLTEAIETVGSLTVSGGVDAVNGLADDTLLLGGRLASTSGDINLVNLQNVSAPSVALDSARDLNIGSQVQVVIPSNIQLEAGQNIVLGSGSRLETLSTAGSIRGVAGSNVILGSGVFIVRPLADGDQVTVSNLPGNFTATPQVQEDGISEISSLGEAEIQVDINTVGIDRNFLLTIADASDGSSLFDSRSEGSPDEAGSTLIPLQFDFIAGVAPLGDRDIVVSLQSDIDNQIVFIANNQVLTSTSIGIRLDAPIDGFITAITIESPEVPELNAPARISLQSIPFVDPFNYLATETESFEEAIVDVQVGQPRKYVLRLVVEGEEKGLEREIDIEELPDDILEQENLDRLFDSLTNDRYRIYLVLEDGSEQSVLDVSLNEKEVIEVEEEGYQKRLKILRPDGAEEGMKLPFNQRPGNERDLPDFDSPLPNIAEERSELLFVGKHAIQWRQQ